MGSAKEVGLLLSLTGETFCRLSEITTLLNQGNGRSTLTDDQINKIRNAIVEFTFELRNVFTQVKNQNSIHIRKTLRRKHAILNRRSNMKKQSIRHDDDFMTISNYLNS